MLKNEYYVYVYLDITKPGDFVYDEYHFKYEPFYVGKGKNGRDRVHLKGCKHNMDFKQRIDEIKKTGFNPIVERVWNNLSEIDAFNLEWKMIKIIGTKFSRSHVGPLFNKAFTCSEDILALGRKYNTTYILEHPYVSNKEVCMGKYQFIKFCENLHLDYKELINGKTVNGWKLETL